MTAIEDDDAPFVEEDDSASVSLGWAFHAVMSARARLWRLLAIAYRSLVASAPTPRAASFERQEPNLGGRAGPPLAPHSDSDLDEEIDDEEEEEEVSAARPAQETRTACAGAQIIRQVRVAAGFGA